MRPRISIVTVCFNSEKTLEETIVSVLSQSYTDIEYIIVDGGSRDHSFDIINRYRDKIALVISEPDRGIYDAMNKGIKLATGDVVGFLNSDDIYPHSGVIARIAQGFTQPEIDAVYGDLIYFDSDQPQEIKRYWRSRDFEPGLFAKGFSPAHPTFFAKKKLYEQWGGFDLSYPMGNDVELMMRFLEKHHCRTNYIPEVLVNMRLGGVSNRSIKNILIQNYQIIRAARKLNIPMSVTRFAVHKLIERWQQFFKEPKREAIDVQSS